MECNLDQIGSLLIWRKDQFKIALCPYSHAGANQSGDSNVLGFGSRPCGDWCPMFIITDKHIKICNGVIYDLIADFRIPKDSI